MRARARAAVSASAPEPDASADTDEAMRGRRHRAALLATATGRNHRDVKLSLMFGEVVGRPARIDRNVPPSFRAGLLAATALDTVSPYARVAYAAARNDLWRYLDRIVQTSLTEADLDGASLVRTYMNAAFAALLSGEVPS